MAKQSHQWSFIHTTILDEKEVGPIPEAKFIKHIKAGDVKAKTQVSSATRTKGGWLTAAQIPNVAKMIDQVEAAKAKEKAEAKEGKRQQKEVAKEKRQSIKADRQRIKAEKSAEKIQQAPIVDEDSSPPEKVVYDASPSMFRQSPVLFAILSLLCLPLVGIPFMVIWYLKCRAQRLTVTNEKTTLRHGLLSKHESEVWHSDVRNVEISMGVIQRMFQVGSIAISSAASGGAEIVAVGYRQPEQIKSLLNQYRRANR